jgi:predicted nucleic acid-binding protein
MPAAAVIDASVAVKWFLPAEDHAEDALALLHARAAGSVRLVVPSLLFYEVSNALLVAVRRNRLAREDYLDALEALFRLGLEAADLPDYHRRAAALAYAYGRSAYDAAYLALAESRGAVFLTADRRLYNAVGEHLPWVRWLADWRETLS